MVIGINDLIINGIKAKKDVLGVNFFTFNELSNYVESIYNVPDLDLMLDFGDIDFQSEIIEIETGYEIKDIDSFYESYMEDIDNKKRSKVLLDPDLLNESVFADAGLMVYDNNGKLQAVSEDKTDAAIRGLTADRVHQLVNDYLSDIYSLYRERKTSEKISVDSTFFKTMPTSAYFLIRRDRLVSDAYLLFRIMDSFESEDELIPIIKSEIQEAIKKELDERYDYYQSLSNIDCNGIRIDLLKNFRSRSEVLDDNLITLDSFVKRDKISNNILNGNRSKHEKKI